MTTNPHLNQNHERVIGVALAGYSVLILGSMATMSIGFTLAFLAIAFLGRGGLKGLGRSVIDEIRGPAAWYFSASVALLGIWILSLVCARLNPLEYGGRGPEVNWLKDLAKAWYLFAPFALLVGLRQVSAVWRERIWRTWIITFGVLSLIGVIQHFTGWPRHQGIPGTVPERFHATLLMGHHLSVASVWIFPFFAALDRLLDRPRDKWLWAFVLAGAMTLFFTWSRTLWVGLPFGILFWIWLRGGWKRGLGATLVGVALLFGVYEASPYVRERIAQGSGVSERQLLWQGSLEFLRARPWSGVGFGKPHALSGYYQQSLNPGAESVFSAHSHNNVLETLAGTGIPGTLIWFFWCAAMIAPLIIVWRSRASFQTSFPVAGWLAAWLVFHINGLTQVNIWEGKVEHQIAWVVAWSLWMLRRDARA